MSVVTRPIDKTITYPITGGLGDDPWQNTTSLYQWEKPLWPNFPATVMGTGFRVANMTTSGTGATISDVTGPNGELGVRVTMGTGTFRLSFQQAFDINLTQGNLEVDIRPVSNSGNLGTGSAVSLVVSSGTSGGFSDALATNNNRSVAIENKQRVHIQGSTNLQTLVAPNFRIATVAGTGADMTHITGMRFGTNRTANAGAVFDIFEVRYRPNPRIADLTPVFFRFDGGSVSQYDYARPALISAFGNCSMAFLTFGKRFLNTPGFLTDSQFQTWLAAGAEYAPHGGYTTDNALADRAAYYAEIAPHRDWARQYGIANGYPNLDHMSAWETQYSNTGSGTQGFRQVCELDRLGRCILQYNTANVGATPMYLGGGAWPPPRWGMECLSANSFDNTGVWPTDADVIASVEAMMSNANDNKGQVGFAWHDGLGLGGADKATLVFDTVVARCVANPDKYLPCGYNALIDSYVTQYGGIT